MKVSSLEDYESVISEIKDRFDSQFVGSPFHLLFRGHALESYKLLPTIARDKRSVDEILDLEKRIQQEFEKRMVDGYIGTVKLNFPQDCSSFYYKWCIQFQIRHLELPTRLIDWSMRPEVALFFAVSNPRHHGSDGHVWVHPSIKDFARLKQNPTIERMKKEYLHLSAGFDDLNVLGNIDPFNPEKITLVHNSYSGSEFRKQIGEVRKARQAGKFTVSTNAKILVSLDKTFIGQNMIKIIVDGSAKQGILDKVLAKYPNLEEWLLPEIPHDTLVLLDEIRAVTTNR